MQLLIFGTHNEHRSARVRFNVDGTIDVTSFLRVTKVHKNGIREKIYNNIRNFYFHRFDSVRLGHEFNKSLNICMYNNNENIRV